MLLLLVFGFGDQAMAVATAGLDRIESAVIQGFSLRIQRHIPGGLC